MTHDELKSAYGALQNPYWRQQKANHDHRQKYGCFPSQSIMKFIKDYLEKAK